MSEDERATAEGMQTCWSDSTPGEIHASFSGHRTLCGKPVIEANPIYASRLGDITCSKCGGIAVFDEGAARTRVREVLDKWIAKGKLTPASATEMGNLAIDVFPGRAFTSRRKGHSWNKISTDFLLASGAATDKDASARFVGELGLAVFEGLQASEYQGKY
ncbi:hypothetical protein AB0B15_17165 [Streptomyces sp. NPDC045456]|uniref:hypothetical protein n=1 Tax=Streptomyces sp. NPDC045456 TaxID=3155254 RepID=UPI0033DC2A1C